MKMQAELRMAYDIAAQFRHLSLGQAAEVIAHHIRTFWDPRMRGKLIEQVASAGIHCDSRVTAATRLLCGAGGDQQI